MKPLPTLLRRQRGAIAIMFGLTLVVLLGAGGLVIDLGHLYVLKSELQNGADSAALAGAKQIDMTPAGITKAAAKALAFAAENKFNFSSTLTLTNSNVAFGSGPDGPWFSVADAFASPAGKTFIKVDTGTKTVSTYLMGAAGIPTIATNGVAVAGRFVVDITPLGVCALPPYTRTSMRLTNPAVLPQEQELVEYGFRRGTTYDLLQLGKIAGSSDPMLLNPVDSPPTACNPSHSNANFTAPFVCQGNSTVANNVTEVYANTGVSVGPIEKAINSRFNDYPGGSQCSPVTSPPDRNVREYVYNNSTNVDWMNPAQSAQSQPISNVGLPTPALTAATQGVLWTYSRPVRAIDVPGAPGTYDAGTAFATSDWAKLYNSSLATTGTYPAGIGASPYAETSGAAHFLAPTPNIPTADRRLMNLAIVNCAGVGAGGMACKRLPILGVGRFFLQRRANLAGAGAGIWVEFAGLIDPVPKSEIKLYR
ncbi:MAG: Tad domain-containing protein [Pseudomonadota bacterium]